MTFKGARSSKLQMGLSLFCLTSLVSCDITPTEPVLDGNISPKNRDVLTTPGGQLAAHEDAMKSAAPARPNILLIVADDLGYFDIGAFGGEIDTPNLDSLANKGVRFRQLRAAPVCAPSRAMLMTGMDNHLVGIGAQFPRDAQIGAPGYEGFLSPNVETIAEMLHGAGYETFMAGKWHLGREEQHSPASRGFDSSFALLLGAAGHFDMSGPGPGEGLKALYRENGKLVEELPVDFYSTDFYTDRIIKDIDQSLSNDKPFFAYVAYTSPHWPLQAPEEILDKYKGAYDEGYEAICHARFEKAIKLGVISDNTDFNGCRSLNMPWANLNDEEKRREARIMEIYAAMVHNLDENIGRIIARLAAVGELENTFILFMSDNGADGMRRENMPAVSKWIDENFDNSFDNLGRPGSYVSTGQNWASVSMSPMRDFKGTASEGGIRVPAIAAYSGIDRRGGWVNGRVTIRDVAPTFMELAGATPSPDAAISVQGRSFLGELRDPGKPSHPENEVFAWENDGSIALLQGDYKLVRNAGQGDDSGWKLFNLAKDPFETTDISADAPAKTVELVEQFHNYENQVGVVYSNRSGPPQE